MLLWAGHRTHGGMLAIVTTLLLVYRAVGVGMLLGPLAMF